MDASSTTSWLVESALATASCVAIVANLLVILIFFKRPGLRTVSNRFVINLLATNLLSSAVLIPLLLADEISKSTEYSFRFEDEIVQYTSEINKSAIMESSFDSLNEKGLVPLIDDAVSSNVGFSDNLVNTNSPKPPILEDSATSPNRRKSLPNAQNSLSSKSPKSIPLYDKIDVFTEKVLKKDINLKLNSFDVDTDYYQEDEQFPTQEPSIIEEFENDIVVEQITINETSNSNDFNNSTKRYRSGAYCYLAEGGASLVCTASILSVLLIAIDQYYAVIHPLRYHMRISHLKSIILIASSWIISLALGVIGAITPSKNESLWNFCSDKRVYYPTSDYETYRTFYAFTYFIFIILVPFLAICTIYVCIYTAAHKNSERMRHTNSGSITINIETYAPVPIEAESKSDITEDGLMLKIDDHYHPSLETLKEIPVPPVTNWGAVNETEIKKVSSVPNFNTINEMTESDSTIHKSPSVIDNSDMPESCIVAKSTHFADTIVRKSSSVTDTKSPSCGDAVEYKSCLRKSSSAVDNTRKLSIEISDHQCTDDNENKQRTGSLKSTHSFMNSLKCRISNASLFRYREETRAAKISAIVIVMVLACYIPYGIALVLHTEYGKTRKLAVFDSISLIHLVFASVISPFLFAYRNRRIKREIRKMFRLRNDSDEDFRNRKTFRTASSLKPKHGRHHNHLTIIKPNTLTPFLENNEQINICVEFNSNNKSILKRVCDRTKIWNHAKKCNFISVPESCFSTECRSSFSSHSSQNSTQLSNMSEDT